MHHFNCEFTAVYFSNRRISLVILPLHSFPDHPTPEDLKILWDDVIQCFVQGRFYAAARSLQTLSYKPTSPGMVSISGPLKTRKEILHLLTPYRNSDSQVGLVVRIKFLRIFGAEDSSSCLNIEHWVGRLWNTERDDEKFSNPVRNQVGSGQDKGILETGET